MIQRCAAAAIALSLFCVSSANAKATHHSKNKAVAPIAVFINGAPLALDPPPRYVAGRLLVPVRRILDALGLPFDRIGNKITTQVADRTIWLTPGSDRASVNGAPIVLESAPLEIKGVLFAPLRFFTAGLGAEAVYDPKTQRVEISSSSVGQSSTVHVEGSTREYKGVVEAVDNDSNPPAITVTSGASVKTLRVSSTASVVITDVVASATAPGTLQDIHVGDYATLMVNKDGRVKSIVDAFASRHGRISALAGNTIVLSDGHVITPTGVTSLSLNGEGAKVSDLQIADELTVRYNLDTSEVREIIATRKSEGTPPPPGPVNIVSITASAARPLRQGESFDVVMRGTPHGQATYDVGPYFTGLPLPENTAGVYSAHFTIPRGANFSSAPIFGHLRVGDVEAPRAQSDVEISASSTPPGIGDFAPDQGSVVNNPQPSIYATFAADAVPVSVSSIQLIINGHDVTASAARTASFIEYHPMFNYGDGIIHVTVRVSDLAGNTASKSWTFAIRH